jgi:hypothetical protein
LNAEKKEMRFAVLVVVLIVFGPAAQASSTMASIWGVGHESCGTWIADGSNGAFRDKDVQWILGYVSAYNRFVLAVDRDVTKGLVDGLGLIAWVDNYCTTHPLDQIEPAASRLIDELRRRSGAQ